MKIYKINEFEKIVSEDINDLQKSIHQSIYDKILYPFLQKQDGCIGDGFLVERVSASTISVRAGRAFQYDEDQEGAEPKYRAIQLLEDMEISVGSGDWDSAPGGSDLRRDIIVIRPKEDVIQTAERYIKTAGVGPISLETVDKIIEQLCEIDIVEGTPDPSTPVAPMTPSGWIKIAEVIVKGGVGIETSNEVIDTRPVLTPAVQALNAFTRYVSPSGNGTDATLASAISNLPPEGGSIFLMESVSIDSVVTLPANTLLEGKGPSIVIEIEDGGQLVLGDNCVLRDLSVMTEELSLSDPMIDVSGDFARIEGVVFDLPATGTNTAIEINADGFECEGCTFTETSTNTAILHDSGEIFPDERKSFSPANFSNVVEVSGSSFDIKAEDSGKIFLLDSTSNTIDLNLPEMKKGLIFKFKDAVGNLDLNKATLVREDSLDEIEGLAADFDLDAKFGTWILVCSGTGWFFA